MSMKVIKKSSLHWTTMANLMDYDAACASFSWEAARRELDGLPGNAGLNIAHEAIDRHAAGSRQNHVALRWLDKAGGILEYSYAQMRERTNQFANVLQTLGIRKGDTVYTLMGRVPEIHITAIGTWKNGSVFCPLFAVFGPEPIKARISLGKGRVLVTTATLYHRKVMQLRERLPDLEYVLIVDRENHSAIPPGTHDFHGLLDAADTHFTIGPTAPEDIALLQFTSGTTGKPKGAIHVHAAVIAHHSTAKFALDLHPDDVFWCTADPGWVTGTSYGIIAPLTIGATLIVDEGDFDAERWCKILQDQKATVWYTAPTALRMMTRFGGERIGQYDMTGLRFIASVGEPLNPELVVWAQQAFGLPVHDNWWQTETGGIMIANFVAMNIKPGSMGRPLPGVDAAIIKRGKDGGVQVMEQPNGQGELALRSGWPSMFRGYLGEEARYRECFESGWYLTGDLVKQDADGYFWFVSRADDVIKSSGHLVGPFEVESVLMEHPAVLETAVVGVPDAVTMERVKAFVVLKPGHVPDEALRRDLLAHARKRLGPTMAPKEIEFRKDLPKTHSDKTMRRLLKTQALISPKQGKI